MTGVPADVIALTTARQRRRTRARRAALAHEPRYLLPTGRRAHLIRYTFAAHLLPAGRPSWTTLRCGIGLPSHDLQPAPPDTTTCQRCATSTLHL